MSNACFNSVRYFQYRSLESTYLFKCKAVNGDSQLTLKVFNLAKEELVDLRVKCSFTQIDAEVGMLETLEGRVAILNELALKRLLPERWLPAPFETPNYQHCIQRLEKVVDRWKAAVLVGKVYAVFPQGVPADPVEDDLGHIFEQGKVGIGHRCPMGHQIKSLSSSKALQKRVTQLIDTVEEDIFPALLSPFEIEDEVRASQQLDIAKRSIEAEQYADALVSYAKAFKWTKNWKQLLSIAVKFEQHERFKEARFAYLYLAQYQLLEGKGRLLEVETLFLRSEPHLFDMDILEIALELFYLDERFEDVVSWAVKAHSSPGSDGTAIYQQFSDRMIHIYERILKRDPLQFQVYFHLDQVLTHMNKTQKKSQSELKAVLHAIEEGKIGVAQGYLKRVAAFESNFADALVEVSMQPEGKAQASKLLEKAKIFSDLGQYRDALKCNKLLYSMTGSQIHIRGIVAAYRELKDDENRFRWEKIGLQGLMANQDWSGAYRRAEKLLGEESFIERKIQIQEMLEQVCKEWPDNHHRLEAVWINMSRHYQLADRAQDAEKIMRQAVAEFDSFDTLYELAGALLSVGNTQESVQTYYRASCEEYADEAYDKVSSCLGKIREIDPRMKYLTVNEKMHLINQYNQLQLLGDQLKTIERLRQKLEEQQAQIEMVVNSIEADKYQETQSDKGAISSNKVTTLLLQRATKTTQRPRQRRPRFSQIAI